MSGLVLPDGSVDSEGMLGAALELPEQLLAGIAAADGLGAALSQAARPDSLAVLAVGPDAVVGEALAALGAGTIPVPLVLVTGHVPPAFVGPGTLVLAVCASGGCEVTVAAAEEAAGRGARLLAVTSGGRLATVAARSGGSVVELRAEGARAAFGASLGASLAACQAAGLLADVGVEAGHAAAQLHRRRDALVAAQGGVAREVARRVGRTFPILHAAAGIGAVAASRWRSQINAAAKAPAWLALEPGASHTDVNGFGQHGDVTRQLATLVQLRTGEDDRRDGRRMALTEEYLRETVAQVLEVRAEGAGALAQLLDLVLVGDLVAVYLAAQEGIDPGPTFVADEIERAVADAGR